MFAFCERRKHTSICFMDVHLRKERIPKNFVGCVRKVTLSFNDRDRRLVTACFDREDVHVRDRRIELLASSMSTKRSTTELIAQCGDDTTNVCLSAMFRNQRSPA